MFFSLYTVYYFLFAFIDDIVNKGAGAGVWMNSDGKII